VTVRAWWPTVRAAFVAFHLVAITISALPTAEGGMNRAQWRDPTVQGEFAAWATRLHMEKSEFEEGIWRFAVGWQSIYTVLMKPVRPYESLAGTGQNWKMFVAPHTYPTALEISVASKAGDWAVLYSERDRTAAWRKGTLGVERLRSATFRWGWPSYASAWSNACLALSRLALADFPDADQVRCRFWKAKSPSPQEAAAGVDPPGRWVNIRQVRRGPTLTVEKVPDEPENTGSAPTGAP
jgi:hypothetical protein